nr:putative ribonuclease H-like domain-containing protein [Tanacetum cinerariifolium]
MPEFKGITYSDDEEDVGAEADFTNLETSITNSPIPTTKVHKDHHVTQIIGDLSSSTQTRTYASFMGFMVYQMDVKSAFLYGTIKEEVHVFQPPEFEDPDYLDKVYKVVNVLYGLHQAPRAKEPVFEGRKPQSKVYVSPSSSAQSKKDDDKTKREAKGKSPVESLTGYRNLSAKFQDFSDNSINEINADDSPVSADVGAEADFTNLETSITNSPIPTTKVHKDHHVTQIIGDLSSSTQTRSMIRVAKDQDGLS